MDHPSATLNITAANIPDEDDLRLEVHLHNYVSPSGTNTLAFFNFFDTTITSYGNNTVTFFVRDGACTFAPVGKNLLIRMQAHRALNLVTCESWNSDGTGYEIQRRTVTSWPTLTATNGNLRNISDGSYKLGFMRGYNTLVPLRSRPPATADVGNYFDWKFDGNGNDSSGNSRTIDVTGQSFSATPGQTVASLPTQPNVPDWAPSLPLRAGHPSQLSSNSFTLIDSTAEVSTCFWQQVSGPSKLFWADRTACTATVTGAVFGEYVVRLRVTDAEGNAATRDYTVGAVAYDDNGVVIYPDSRLTKLIGPSLAFGLNPWEQADAKHWELAAANWQFYNPNGYDSDHVYSTVNGTPRSGTITYPKASGGGMAGPTIFGTDTNFLAVFCGGRVGPAVPGSAIQYPIRLAQNDALNRGPWMFNPVVSCESDTEITVSGGSGYNSFIPEPGVEWYTDGLLNLTRQNVTGTVYIDPGVNARKLYGVGTNLQTELCGGGSSPVNRDAIFIFGPTHTDAIGVSSCQSETEITLTSDFPRAAIASPGVNWGARLSTPGGPFGQRFRRFGNVDPNVSFYDVPLAHYILWMRTGLNQPRDAFRYLASRVWNQRQGEPRYNTSISTVLLHEFDDWNPGTPFKDRDLLWQMWHKTFYNQNQFPGDPVTKLIRDPRESAYALLHIALMADFHPDSAVRADLRTKISQFYTNSVESSQDASGRFRFLLGVVGNDANSFTVTNGSATVTVNTGPNLPANYCGDPATFYSTGTITSITNGGTAIECSGCNWTGQANKEILITGTRGGQPYTHRTVLTATPTATTGTLRLPWWGDNNSVTTYRIGAVVPLFMIETNAGNTAITKTTMDEENWYWCSVASDTTLTLDKPFQGVTSSNVYRRILRNSLGHSTSAFMHSLLTTALIYTANVTDLDSTLAANLLEAGRKAQIHVRAMSEPYGYGRLPYHETLTPYCGGYDFPIPNWCHNGGAVLWVPQLKSYAVENIWAMVKEYAALGETWRRDIVDEWYTSIFDSPGYTSPFSTSDPTLRADTITEYAFGGYINAPKFYAQTYGMGNAQAWPAQRVGGASEPVTRPSWIGVSLPAGAADARLSITLPNGTTQSVVCVTSPCDISTLDRRGAPLVTVEYRDGGGNVIARASEPVQLR